MHSYLVVVLPILQAVATIETARHQVNISFPGTIRDLSRYGYNGQIYYYDSGTSLCRGDNIRVDVTISFRPAAAIACAKHRLKGRTAEKFGIFCKVCSAPVHIG